jgi:hypothetical protein
MAVIKWYKEGEFTEEEVSEKLTIVKFGFDDKLSFKEFRYWIGYFTEDSFFVLKDLDLDSYGEINIISSLVKLSYTDSINVKLDKVIISSNMEQGTSPIWYYSQLVKKFGEENITFYHEA